jgi:integrase
MGYPEDLQPTPISLKNRITHDFDLDGASMPPADLATRPHQLPLDLPRTDPGLAGAGLARAGQAADAAAARRVFDAYRDRLAEETRRRHDADLACFHQYLRAAGIGSIGDMTDPASWVGITWGLVAAFVEWQLQQGYAIGSINVRLSTVKVYAKLATKAGSVASEEYALVRLVAGYRHAEGRRIDRKRERTRKGAKKAQPVSISVEQAARLKAQFDPRDRLLMCLLLDHGLRVGEVAGLVADDFDLDRGILRFYRSKVDKTQQHRLSADALAAANAYLPSIESKLFPVDRTIRTRVGQLGLAIGLAGLSPHDCRHSWATAATRNGTPLKALQDAGGWSSPAMPLRYAESAEVANDGVKLD